MRAGSLRAFVALVPLIGVLNGCAQTRQLDGWLSQSEPRTWAAHTVEVAAAQRRLWSDVEVPAPAGACQHGRRPPDRLFDAVGADPAMIRVGRLGWGRTASGLAATLLLSGCATARSVEGWLTESDPRTWAAHSAETAAFTVTSDVVLGSPWYGYVFGVGARLGWEASQWRPGRTASGWGTVMDLVLPAVTGFVVAKWLDGRDGEESAGLAR